MKELREISIVYEELRREGKAAALATIVKVSGSSYRRPGARMLMTQDGILAGSVSGGCLESDVWERARQVLSSGAAMVVTYDTTSEEDVVFGVGLGCNGVIHILIEPLAASDVFALQVGVIATVFRVEGVMDARLGDRLLMPQDGPLAGDIAEPPLVTAILADADQARRAGHSQTKVYAVPGGSVEVFLEVLLPPPALIILGAGADAMPLVRIAKEIGWRVTVTDHRPAHATRDRFPDADRVFVASPESAMQHVTLDERTAVVVMTHNYLYDLQLLSALPTSELPYLGILGPKRRTDRLLADLRRDGKELPESFLHCLHSPIGLDIGADTPEEIALSIIAEIRAVFAGRAGGPLRERSGPIYPAYDSNETVPGERPVCALSAS